MRKRPTKEQRAVYDARWRAKFTDEEWRAMAAARVRNRLRADPVARSKANAATKRWHEAHPEYAREYRQLYGVRNGAAWRKRHPEKARAAYVEAAHRRRLRERGATGKLTHVEWAAQLASFGHRCGYCGRTSRLTRDHVIPLSRGGEHTIANVVPACHSCNSRKQARGPLAMVNTTYRGGV